MMLEVCKIVALYRLSKEGRTKDGKPIHRGLSIDAQHASVHGFADERQWIIEKEFTELISGRKKDRPILQEALDYCRQHKCILVIARLDRLARRVALISALLESKIHFRVVQFPDIDPKENPFYFQILAAVSELEVKFIRERTIAALQAKKARGEELGTYGKYVLSKLNKENANLFAQALLPLITSMKDKGIKSIRKITDELNRLKIPTYRNNGSLWHPTSVFNVMQRLNQISVH